MKSHDIDLMQEADGESEGVASEWMIGHHEEREHESRQHEQRKKLDDSRVGVRIRGSRFPIEEPAEEMHRKRSKLAVHDLLIVSTMSFATSSISSC